ncbi:uncharacterized protein RHO25_002707 [Cercospora beticola]|uniref:PARP catalytic domain-containing protein n=2 Tax=Cercospora beticola TaxID=122368 RepID=A0ABZ0NEY4_CERBT|nr:hypothetical protein RHO25_002707 [Cercospora beticola]CAK1359309.1 unnamed protein product [Cercospora beticola]
MAIEEAKTSRRSASRRLSPPKIPQTVKMVRQHHFLAVPSAVIRKQIKWLAGEQARIEGKASPHQDARRPSADYTKNAPTPEKAKRQFHALHFHAVERADLLLEQHLPHEVVQHTGSLQEGKLTFELPIGTLNIEVDSCLKRIKMCRLVSEMFISRNVDVPPELTTAHSTKELATHVLQLIEKHLVSPHAELHKYVQARRSSLSARMLKSVASPRDICRAANLKQYGWKFLKATSIRAHKLQERLQQRIASMREELDDLPIATLALSVPTNLRLKSKARMIDYMLTPRHAFHGTNSAILDSIAKWGLLGPGDTNPMTGLAIPKRLGSTYGPGIYVTTEVHLANTYSNWDEEDLLFLDPAERAPGKIRKRVVICAVILGRAARVTLADGFREKLNLFPDAHSHVANNGQEYVLPKEQVLPLYIADFDWVPESVQQKKTYVEYAESLVCPPAEGDVDKLGRWWRPD